MYLLHALVLGLLGATFNGHALPITPIDKLGPVIDPALASPEYKTRSLSLRGKDSLPGEYKA